MRITGLLQVQRPSIVYLDVASDAAEAAWAVSRDPLVASTAISAHVTSTNGVAVSVERAMWWPGVWREGHGSTGSTQTGSRWAIAGAEVVPAVDWLYFNSETYLLVSNTAMAPADVRVTVVLEDGRTLARSFVMVPRSRLDVAFRSVFPETQLTRFAAIVEGVGSTGAGLVVEHSSYSDRARVEYGGRFAVVVATPWAAGSSAPAVRLP